MLELYLIRHAESVNNRYNHQIVAGIAKDVALTLEGEKQAAYLGQRLKDEKMHFDKIFSSTAIRASKTVDIASVVAGYDTSKIIRSDELLETNRGKMAGMNREDAKAFFSLPYVDTWKFHPTDGESNEMAGNRMYDYLKENLDGFKYSGRVAVFGHGNIFRAFIKMTFGQQEKNEFDVWDNIYNLPFDNTSITHLTYDGKRWDLEKMNDIRHLEVMNKVDKNEHMR